MSYITRASHRKWQWTGSMLPSAGVKQHQSQSFREHEFTTTRPRVAIFGNSNSLMRSSYALKLMASDQFDVFNYSLGAAPNASLLYFMAQAKDQNFDYIVVEPAVVDAEWMRLGHYDRETLDRNFRLFLDFARSRWDARIIMLLIPTVPELRSATHSPRKYYRDMADRYDLSVVDLYSLFEQYFSDNPDLTDVFFSDALHLSCGLFDILAGILGSIMVPWNRSEASSPQPASERRACDFALPVGWPAGSMIDRRTSSIAATLAQLGPGDTVEFHADAVVSMTSILVNRQRASALVEITSDLSHSVLVKDLRLLADPQGEFVLHLVPLITPIRGRHFQLRVLPPDEQESCTPEPTNFQNPRVCSGLVEINGAVLIGDEAPLAAAPAPARLGADRPWTGSHLLRSAYPVGAIAAIEARVQARAEAIKDVMTGFLGDKTVFSRRKFSQTLDVLASRIEQAETWERADIYREFGDALFMLGDARGAERYMTRAHELQPGSAHTRDLLRRIQHVVNG